MNDDNLRSVYAALMTSRVDFRTRVWETIKIAATLAAGSLAGVGGVLASGRATTESFLGLGLALILIGGCLALWTYVNVKRESELQYYDEFPLYQIEKLLGLHDPIREYLRWKPDAPHMFGHKHLHWQYGYAGAASLGSDPVENWVKGRIATHKFVNSTFVFVLILIIPMLVVGWQLCLWWIFSSV